MISSPESVDEIRYPILALIAARRTATGSGQESPFHSLACTMKITCPSCNSEVEIGFSQLASLDWRKDRDDEILLKCCGCVPIMPLLYRLISTLFSIGAGALTFKLWNTPLDQDTLIKTVVFFFTMLVVKAVIAICYLKMGGKLESAG